MTRGQKVDLAVGLVGLVCSVWLIAGALAGERPAPPEPGAWADLTPSLGDDPPPPAEATAEPEPAEAD